VYIHLLNECFVLTGSSSPFSSRGLTHCSCINIDTYIKNIYSRLTLSLFASVSIFQTPKYMKFHIYILLALFSRPGFSFLQRPPSWLNLIILNPASVWGGDWLLYVKSIYFTNQSHFIFFACPNNLSFSAGCYCGILQKGLFYIFSSFTSFCIPYCLPVL
jgi:hypothetical protein